MNQDVKGNIATAAREAVRNRIIAVKNTWAKGASLAEIRAGFEALLAYPGGPFPEPVIIGHVSAAWIPGRRLAGDGSDNRKR